MENKNEQNKQKEKGKVKSLSPLTRILILALVAIGVIVLVIFVYQAINQPLAPTMEVVTSTPDISNAENKITNTPIYIIVTATQSPSTSTPTPTVTPVIVEPTATSVPVCNEKGSMNIVLIGVNEDSGIWPPGAEMIRLVKVDFNNQTIKMVAFPRDLFVDTSGMAYYNMPQQTLGLTYYYAEHSNGGSKKQMAAAGASMLSRTLLEDFDVEADHYLVMDADMVPTLIDKVGGIIVDVPYTVTGYDGVVFPEGWVTMNGAQVLNYVSFRDDQNESARYQRQQRVIDAFLDKAISLDMVPKIPTVLSEVGKKVITDLSVSQIANIGCLVESMDRERIDSYDLQKNNMTWYTTNGILIPNTDAIKDYLNDTLE